MWMIMISKKKVVPRKNQAHSRFVYTCGLLFAEGDVRGSDLPAGIATTCMVGNGSRSTFYA